MSNDQNVVFQRFYIFINCSPGTAYEVGLALAKAHLPYVTEISSVSGDWDLILRINIDTRQNIGQRLAEDILSVKGIERSKTIVAYDVR